jgi:hypothetical protein
MLFSCEICRIYTGNRSDYKKHLRTKKHIKLTKTDISTVDEITFNGDDYDNSPIENDEAASENYIVLNISEIPNKPKRLYNGVNIAKKVKPSYNKDNICSYCGLGYSHLSGLYRHMKKCVGPPKEPQTNTVVPNLNGVINTLLYENKEFKKLILDVIKTNSEIIKSNQELVSSQHEVTNKMLELCNKNNAAPVTNNIYNHKGDNHFNLNLFLNDTCKDAMNMSDFVNSIEVTMDDMENVGRCGYVEGISSIFIDNLKNTDIHKRPIHCSDRKRQTLYVKDSDKWERDEESSQILKTAVLRVEHKHARLINKWTDEHPGCEKSYSRDNNMYTNICRNITDGEDEKNVRKIIKNIANETVIEKNALMS